MDNIPLGALIAALIFLILASAFFSASEISMMALNRYRLRHQAENGNKAAQVVMKLLERPDRLLGVILLGNNLANILASSITTIIALRFFGEPSIAAATFLLTLVILVFAEVAPKSLAALKPEIVAFPSGWVLHKLLYIAYPFVWVVNQLAAQFLKLFGISLGKAEQSELSMDELRSAVQGAKRLIPKTHQDMLLGILDLEAMTVDDVMVPRGEIEGIDISLDSEEIIGRLTRTNFTRMPVYDGNLDDVIGVLHIRKVLALVKNNELNRQTIERVMASPYFIPEGTPLSKQLLNFKSNKRRLGLVIDEYGDILGLLTVEEILEEIVGEFTKDTLGKPTEIQPQKDGSYIVTGGTNIRELNRSMGWNLPTSGARTLNGLITDVLEDIPQAGTSLTIGDFHMEILKTRGTAVQVAKLTPASTQDTDS